MYLSGTRRARSRREGRTRKVGGTHRIPPWQKPHGFPHSQAQGFSVGTGASYWSVSTNLKTSIHNPTAVHVHLFFPAESRVFPVLSGVAGRSCSGTLLRTPGRKPPISAAPESSSLFLHRVVSSPSRPLPSEGTAATSPGRGSTRPSEIMETTTNRIQRSSTAPQRRSRRVFDGCSTRRPVPSGRLARGTAGRPAGGDDA